jgi:hypothetical protein
VVLANAPCGGFIGEIANGIADALLDGRESPSGGARSLVPFPNDVPARIGYPASPSVRGPESGARIDVAKLTGTWEGRLEHFDGDIPLRLVVKDANTVEVSFGGRPPLRLRNAGAADREVHGRVEALIRTQLGFHGVPDLDFRLEFREGRLRGIVVAIAEGYFAMAYWVELERGARV